MVTSWTHVLKWLWKLKGVLSGVLHATGTDKSGNSERKISALLVMRLNRLLVVIYLKKITYCTSIHIMYLR